MIDLSEKGCKTSTEEGIKIQDGYVTLSWSGADYDIALSRIKNERDLLAWAYHLSDKTWMNTTRIGLFVALVASHKGFDLATV